MSRRLFKRIIPEHDAIRENKYLQIFGRLHLDPNLWHLNRYSVANAFSVGLFTMFMPIPFQMVMAALLAILLRCNLPISVALVWITNPVTAMPMMFFAYQMGSYLMGITPDATHADTIWQQFGHIWQPLLFGLFICGIISAIVGNLAVRLIWRLAVASRWRMRQRKRTNNNNDIVS